MSYEIINIPKEYKYISQVPEFKQDLPDNVYLDKTSTGCGATYAVLTNDVNYVVAVPFISLGENKVDQSESNLGGEYPYKLLMVSGKTSDQEIREYLQGEAKKIIVTYDSLPRLMRFINPKNYKLFIDEAHKLIEYAGNFKPKVIYDLLDKIDDFRAYLLCTATPTRERYLPEKVKPMRKIKLNWEAGKEVTFNHIHLKQNQLRPSILALCLEHLRGKDGNLYIFYNSVVNVAKLCKDLVSLYGYTSEDINVICADTENNVKTLKRAGKGFYPRRPVEKVDSEAKPNIKKINFVTSTAFEGQDFWDPDGITFIVSDSRLDHTKLDISTQVSQIVGRLRDSKYGDTVTLLWTVSPILGFKTLEEYEVYVGQRELQFKGVVKDFNTIQTDIGKSYFVEGSKTEPFLIDNSEGERLDIMLNPDAKNHLLNVYEGTEIQYYVNTQNLPDVGKPVREHICCTLKEVFLGEVNNSFDIPTLSNADKLKLGYKGSYPEITTQYIKTLLSLQNKDILLPEEIESLEEFKGTVESNSRFDTLVEYIKTFGISSELIESSSTIKSERTLAKKIAKHKDRQRLKELLSYKYTVDQTIDTPQLKEDLKSIYDLLDLTGNPKLTDISLAFEVVATSCYLNHKRVNAFKLVRKL